MSKIGETGLTKDRAGSRERGGKAVILRLKSKFSSSRNVN